MVLKFIKILFIFFIFFFIKLNSFANVVYDKNNIVITELDIEYYKKFHNEKYKEEISHTNALKKLVMIKNLIISLENNNPEFLKKVDRDIARDIGDKNINSKTVFDIVRFFKTKNAFIINYFNNNFKRSDLEIIFNKFNKLELPISDNNCLTITELVNLKNNIEFYDIFYDNLKKNKREYKVLIKNRKMDVCINQKNYEIIQDRIFKYIELLIKKDFDEFVYAQQKN